MSFSFSINALICAILTGLVVSESTSTGTNSFGSMMQEFTGFNRFVRILTCLPFNGMLSSGCALSVYQKHDEQNTLNKQLLEAADRNKWDEVKQLIERGADVNAKTVDERYISNNGWTALHYASYNAKLEIVKYLVEKGADVNAKVKNIEWTPLFSATRFSIRHDSESLEVVKFLVEKGANINVKTNDEDGWAPIHGAASGRSASKLPIIKYLVEKGADYHAKDNNGKTLLQIACHPGNMVTVKYLMDLGIDINNKDNEGESALDYVISSYDIRMANILRAAGGKAFKNSQEEDIFQKFE